jgi:hypothetical protein
MEVPPNIRRHNYLKRRGPLAPSPRHACTATTCTDLERRSRAHLTRHFSLRGESGALSPPSCNGHMSNEKDSADRSSGLVFMQVERWLKIPKPEGGPQREDKRCFVRAGLRDAFLANKISENDFFD